MIACSRGRTRRSRSTDIVSDLIAGVYPEALTAPNANLSDRIKGVLGEWLMYLVYRHSEKEEALPSHSPPAKTTTQQNVIKNEICVLGLTVRFRISGFSKYS